MKERRDRNIQARGGKKDLIRAFVSALMESESEQSDQAVGIFYYVTNEIKSFQWAWTKIYHLLVFFDTDMLKSILQQVVLISEHS
jgi:hypothetical protein